MKSNIYSRLFILTTLFGLLILNQGCFEGISKNQFVVGTLKNGKHIMLCQYNKSSMLSSTLFPSSVWASLKYYDNDSVIERYTDESIRKPFDFKLIELNDSVVEITYKDSSSKQIISANKRVVLKNKYPKGEDF